MEQMNIVNLVLFIVIGIAGWFLICSFVVGLLSIVGGWFHLAQVHPLRDDENHDGVRYSFQTIYLRFFVSYRRSVHITLSETGIMLRTVILFRFLHKPVFIKWDDIVSVQKKEFFLYRGVVIQTRHAKVFIAGKSAEEITKRYAQ